MTAELPADFKVNGRYNKRQAAIILGISPTTLYKRIQEGLISVEINRKTQVPYIKGTSIMKFFNS